MKIPYFTKARKFVRHPIANIFLAVFLAWFLLSESGKPSLVGEYFPVVDRLTITSIEEVSIAGVPSTRIAGYAKKHYSQRTCKWREVNWYLDGIAVNAEFRDPAQQR